MDATQAIDIANHWGLLAGLGAVLFGIYKLVKLVIANYRALKVWVQQTAAESIKNGLDSFKADLVKEVEALFDQRIAQHELVEERKMTAALESMRVRGEEKDKETTASFRGLGSKLDAAEQRLDAAEKRLAAIEATVSEVEHDVKALCRRRKGK